LVFIVFCGLFVSCKQHKDLQRPLRNRSTSYLVEKVHENEFKCKWISLKTGVAFKTDKLSDSFKMHIRMRTDSVIWISTTYYAVEVARFFITPDSVKFMDRKAKQFFVGNMEYLNQKFNLDLDFKSLQALILGNSMGIDVAVKNKSYHNDGLYHISSVGKREMRMADKGESPNYDIASSTAIYPKIFKVARTSMKDYKANKSLTVDYKKHTNIDEQLLPNLYDIQIDADKDVNATVEYLKIQTNKSLKFSFNIPEKYEQIQ
jgi:hypothetical protein